MTKKEILLKQRNAENAPLTDYIGTDGYVWKMIENAMEEYHQAKLKLLGIADVTHSSFVSENGSCHTITDGDSTWNKKCCECGKLSMQVVRPGKVQCRYCG